MQQSCLVEVAIKVAAGKQCIDVALHAEHHAVRAQPCARRRPHRFKHTEIACALARVSPDLSHNIQTPYTGIQARKLMQSESTCCGPSLSSPVGSTEANNVALAPGLKLHKRAKFWQLKLYTLTQTHFFHSLREVHPKCALLPVSNSTSTVDVQAGA